MEPIIDHIEITVRDMGVAVPFYDRLLPLLGFDLESRNSAVLEDHELHVVEYLHPRLGFAINSPRSAFRGDAVNRRSDLTSPAHFTSSSPTPGSPVPQPQSSRMCAAPGKVTGWSTRRSSTASEK